MKTDGFKLDTSPFAESANATKKLATVLEEAIGNVDKAINSLYGCLLYTSPSPRDS